MIGATQNPAGQNEPSDGSTNQDIRLLLTGWTNVDGSLIKEYLVDPSGSERQSEKPGESSELSQR